MRAVQMKAFVAAIVLVAALLHAACARDLKEQVRAIVRNRDVQEREWTPVLQSWVREQSLQGQEHGVQQLIANKLLELGMTVDQYVMNYGELKKSTYFFSPRSSFEHSPIVVGVLKGTRSRQTDDRGAPAVDISAEGQVREAPQEKNTDYHSIILNGHVDVVPVNDASQWTRDPFSGDIIVNSTSGERWLHGRGSTDMKGGILANFVALDVIRKLNISLKGDIIFESVVEEESGGSGTLSTILRGYKADAAIIPEPTKMKIFPKQQGSMWFRLTVKGLAAHGGTRYDGVSAIEKSMTVVQAVLDFEESRNAELRRHPLYSKIPIPVPINIGIINGGKWPSSVADVVQLEGRMGVSPFERIEAARADMEGMLVRLSERDSWFKDHPVALEWFGAQWLPGNVDLDHQLMAVLTKSFKDVLDREPVVEGSPWGTDGALLTSLADTPAIIFGPGDTPQAHFRDETVSLDRVYECAEVIALAIIEWCGVEAY